MKVAAIKSCGQWHGAEVFSPNDILAANQLGVIVQYRRSKTVGEKYQACCCPLCGVVFGQFYFHDHVAMFSETSSHRIGGSFCPGCEKSFDVE